MGRYAFQPKLVPTLAALAGCAILICLGFWQLSRHEEKQALLALAQTRVALPPVSLEGALARPDAHLFQRVRARGVYLFDETVLVLSRRNFSEGSIVLTPLLAEGLAAQEGHAAAILVDRGWVSAGNEEAILAQHGRSDPVDVIGSLLLLPERKDDTGSVSPPTGKRRRWLSLNLPAIRAQAPLPVVKAIIKRGDAEDGDIPEGSWALPTSRVNHLEYAWTWFLIAATLVGVYLSATLKRVPSDSSRSGV